MKSSAARNRYARLIAIPKSCAPTCKGKVEVPEANSPLISWYGTIEVMIMMERFKLRVKPTAKNALYVAVAMPLLCGGADSIIELEIGELNIPVPNPNSTMYPMME